MINLQNLIQTQLMALILISIGIVLRIKGIFVEEVRTGLSSLILGLLLPASILKAFVEVSAADLRRMVLPLCVSAAIQIVLILISRCCYRKSSPQRIAFQRYSIQFSNCGFLGLPICLAVFGQEGLACAAVIQIPVLIGMWTSGLALFKGSAGTFRTVLRQLATTPAIVATALGLILMAVQISLPDVVLSTVQALAGCLTPLVMLLIGSMLYGGTLGEMFRRPVVELCAVRLLLIPAVVMGLCWLLRMDALTAGVMTLMFAMSIPTIGVILSVQYQKDVRFANNAVLLSTAVSMVTIPLCCILLQRLYL